jgi:hypothetical protein
VVSVNDPKVVSHSEIKDAVLDKKGREERDKRPPLLEVSCVVIDFHEGTECEPNAIF